jgi:hypothetical protein
VALLGDQIQGARDAFDDRLHLAQDVVLLEHASGKLEDRGPGSKRRP